MLPRPAPVSSTRSGLRSLGLVVGVLLSLAACRREHTVEPPKNCEDGFDNAEVSRYVRSSVARVYNEIGTGTGWVVTGKGLDDRIHIVTNYHVVEGGRRFSAEFEGLDGQKISVSDLEVVKVDPGRDLALLRTPRLAGIHQGLELRTNTPGLGTRIAAFGFPSVVGSGYQLTFEPGDVTSDLRTFEDGFAYITTNANINPGNSGGPVVDQCGRAVGVVVARVVDVERVGLVIPASDLDALIQEYLHPSGTPEQRVSKQVETLFSGIRQGKTIEAVGAFSPVFMGDRMIPLLATLQQDMNSRINGYVEAQGLTPIFAGLTFDEQQAVILQVLTAEEYDIYLINVMVQAGLLTELEAARILVATYVPILLQPEGEGWVLTGHRVESLRIQDQDARALVVLEWENGVTRQRMTTRWLFILHERWGDWGVESFDPA